MCPQYAPLRKLYATKIAFLLDKIYNYCYYAIVKAF